MITLDPNHFGKPAGGGGSMRGEVKSRGYKRKEESSQSRPTSVVVSWVGRCKAKANLNGGELDFEYERAQACSSETKEVKQP